MHSLTIDLPELARVLRRAESTLPRLLPKLYKNGFPRALPGLPNLWSRAAVQAWIDGTALEGAPVEGEIEAATKALEARAARNQKRAA